MSPVEIAALGIAALLALGPAAIFAGRGPRGSALIYGAAGALCAGLALTGIAVLVTRAGPDTLALPVGLPGLGAHLRLDALSAFFLAVLGIGGAAASLYAIGYGRHEAEPMRVLPFYPAFLGAMALVLVADDAFSFLLGWEVMSLLSWALVLAHHRLPENRHAGFVYLAMAGFGTMALMLAFGMMAGAAGGYGFAEIRRVEHAPAASALILGLMLLGAGSKAGIAPLHVWLPLAHPAAPSHVSALMSGVMTKVAVYGFIRVVFDLAGPMPWWVSPGVILLGAGTAILGVLFAVMETDLKRALACSTIENIGLVFAALGLSMAFRASGMGAAAALALVAALLHVLNHMAFKSLLFMGAGAVLAATGRRDLDGLGGLIHRMPVTAVLMLGGAMAIAALPPLNGFVSEWLVFQSVLLSPGLPQPVLQLVVPAAGGMIALAAALVVAAFVRIYGVAFLGRARSPEAAAAVETDRFSLAAMAGLAALCLLIGVVPGLVIDALVPVTNLLTGSRLPAQATQPWLTLVPVSDTRSSYNGLLVLVFALLVTTLAARAVHRFASRETRRGPAWDCGFPGVGPVSQYGAGSFAQPVRRVFATTLMGAREEVEMPAPGDLRPARHRLHATDLAWTWIYAPLGAGVGALATRMNRLRYLTLRQYLGLVFAALLVLLTGLALWS